MASQDLAVGEVVLSKKTLWLVDQTGHPEKLGLEPADERPGGLLYRFASGEFALYSSTGRSPGTFTQMAVEVDDLETVVAELKRSGIVFEG